MLAFSPDEDRSLFPADCDVRPGWRHFKVVGEVMQVLDDASLLDVEVCGIVPQGDITADALG
jgi:hypothetical protein